MKQPDFLPKEEGMNQSRIVPSYIQSECQCELCAENYNLSNHMPMMICEQQHNCCFTCVKDIIAIKKVCPFCRSPITQQGIRKNRMIAKIIQEVAKKKGITLQVYERPQEVFNPKKSSQRKQVVINDPIDDIIIPPERLDDVLAALLHPQHEVVYNQSCLTKFCRKIEISDGLFCFTYFLTLIYNLPFFVCELNYATNLQHQKCLDNDYGAGLTVRQWLMSSAIIGLSMYGITWFTILMKLCCFNRKSCPVRLMVLNLILFFLKFVGWNIYGIVVISSVSDDDASTCDSSMQSYMQALLIIQIVVICGLCSQFDKRR